MVLVGLTGGIASGKSTISDILRKENIHVIDCDEIVTNFYKDSVFVEGIVNIFGKTVLTRKVFDKVKLGKWVYANKFEMCRLLNYIHPLLYRQIHRELEEHSNDEIVFIDAPTLIESGLINNLPFDLVWATSALKDIQIKRVRRRKSSITDKEIENIFANQLTDEVRRMYADFVLDTNSSNKRLLRQRVMYGLNQIRENY